MDDGVSAELRALRARAYGPDADLDSDPAAAERLAELEAAQRPPAGRTPWAAERPPAAHEPRRPDDEADADADSGAGATAPTEGEAVEDAGPAASGTRPRLSARTILTWAASLVLVAVVAVSATTFATARSAATATDVPEDARVTHITTLLPTGGELPQFFGEYSDDGRTFETFLGLQVFQTRMPWQPGEAWCIFVARADEVNDSARDSWSGFLTQGCSAGAFPAAISFAITEDLPDEVRERYPAGAALQFVLRDIGVDVFLSEPGPEPGETGPDETAEPEAQAAG